MEVDESDTSVVSTLLIEGVSVFDMCHSNTDMTLTH